MTAGGASFAGRGAPPLQKCVFLRLGRAWPEDPPLLPTKDCLWHGARPAVVGLKSKQFCTMESEAAFREVRRLVGELCKLEAPSKKTARSPYLSSLIRRVNQLTATCPLPSSPFKGIWRKGPWIGREWGAWHPISDEKCELSLSPSSEVCKLQFLPTIAGARPNVRLGTRGWAVFSTGGRDMDVHRQLWQDCWGCTLPPWLHVHHCAHGPRRKLDNRLQALELRDWEDHGDEHGREGGKAGGKGRVCKRPASASQHPSQGDQLGLASPSPALLASSSSSSAFPQQTKQRRKA